ncbi:hypothetical protein F9B74_02670 [Pelistega sp. NLN82]|uniref:Uncharacterized protein n=1 Tax=Pelistega ratti TaxID=2652177 RepID=A0A6L9Y443_9BURK|nr:hypothetical protein [Pelistega ratti]NEN75232.1 hypothetical protein [Pelistega ratti]
MPYRKYSELAELVEMMSMAVTSGRFMNKLDDGTYYNLQDSYETFPVKKFENAKKSYAQGIEEDEELLFLFDITLFGSATDGMIITNKKIYFKDFLEDPECIDYVEIDKIIDRKISDEECEMTLCHKGKATKIKIPRFQFFDHHFIQFIAGYAEILQQNNHLLAQGKAVLKDGVDNITDIIFDAFWNGKKVEKIR